MCRVIIGDPQNIQRGDDKRCKVIPMAIGNVDDGRLFELRTDKDRKEC